MNNIENIYSYTASQFEAIDHLLTMGVGAHIAALVFFLIVSRFVSPRYRIATALSCVVMVSAGLILFSQAQLWTEAFAYNASTELYELQQLTFSNGFRYVNWMVTIPCLLVQLLIVLGIGRQQIFKDAAKLILAAWGMIITGYIGQLYEVSDISQLMIWGAISTVFFVVLLYIVGMRVGKLRHSMPAPTNNTIMTVFVVILFAWTLYPIAYLIPYLATGAEGVVTRQLLFTVADVTSKVIYGIMITYIAVHRSASEGYEPAMEVIGRDGYRDQVNA
ncbi:MAG: bacteriorhodopsin [Tunicatimonas sp.]|uniref:bacteriorhodopsin n=1 Tax=Tunicatimonas sp. TaxID=1940096 RepID=UPI003C78DD5A